MFDGGNLSGVTFGGEGERNQAVNEVVEGKKLMGERADGRPHG